MIVRGLRVRFEGGRAVEVDADANSEAMRAKVATDDGAARLGEVALVDRRGRIGPTGTTFFDTLLDENAASHIALGGAYRFSVDDEADRARLNTSAIHVDFMIGSEAIEVMGVTRDGERVPVMRGGDWTLEASGNRMMRLRWLPFPSSIATTAAPDLELHGINAGVVCGGTSACRFSSRRP